MYTIRYNTPPLPSTPANVSLQDFHSQGKPTKAMGFNLLSEASLDQPDPSSAQVPLPPLSFLQHMPKSPTVTSCYTNRAFAQISFPATLILQSPLRTLLKPTLNFLQLFMAQSLCHCCNFVLFHSSYSFWKMQGKWNLTYGGGSGLRL